MSNHSTQETAIHKRTNTVSLEEAQSLVGGYVQLIQLDDSTQMLFDEEGKLKGYPVNKSATFLAEHVLFAGDCVVGDVVLLSGEALWE